MSWTIRSRYGRRLPSSFGQPVVGIAGQDHSLAGLVAPDGERAGANDLRRVGVDVPRLDEGSVVDVGLEDVPRVYGGAHRAQ